MYTQLQLRDSARPPVSLSTLHTMRAKGEKIACLTCYDASFAVLVDEADVDVVLVGDSLGMVIQGHDTTVPVTMDDMVYHCKAVARGLQRPLLMADLPFASYHRSRSAANSVRLMQEGGAEMVKLESGATQFEIVEFLAQPRHRGLRAPGLKPQSVHKTGGFRVQGRQNDAAERMKSRRQVAAVGWCGRDAARVHPQRARRAHHARTRRAGDRHRRGTGYRRADPRALRRARHHPGRKPRFVMNCMEGAGNNLEALKRYVRAVKDRSYPAPEHCFT
jgi:3-methyl-2-oxobutanoate hydroxymethyltransferase